MVVNTTISTSIASRVRNHHDSEDSHLSAATTPTTTSTIVASAVAAAVLLLELPCAIHCMTRAHVSVCYVYYRLLRRHYFDVSAIIIVNMLIVELPLTFSWPASPSSKAGAQGGCDRRFPAHVHHVGVRT